MLRSQPINIEWPNRSADNPVPNALEAELVDSGSSLERNASSSALRESLSSASLDTHSSASDSPTSNLRAYLSKAKPIKSCVSSRSDRSSRRKSVTFALDSTCPSSDDLMTDYNLEMSLVPYSTDEDYQDQDQDQDLVSTPSIRKPRDRELTHMEAMSFKQYHDTMRTKPRNDISAKSPASHYDATPHSPRSPRHSHHFASQESKRKSTHAEPSEPATSGLSLISPLSSLLSIGSEIDRSNSVLHTCLKRAAVPESRDDGNTTPKRWVLSTSLMVTVPVVYSLFMDTLLG